MPLMSGQFDESSAERIADVVQYVEKLRRNEPLGKPRINRQNNFYLGKPDQDMPSGPLGEGAPGTGTGDNLFSIWLGPAWGVEDKDTGDDIEIDYALQDLQEGEYATATRYKGKWYAGCLFSEPGTGV